MKRLLSLGAAALATIVAGCRDGAVTQPGGWRSAAAWSALVHASADGPVWLRVEGAPFGDGGAKPELAMAVASAMSNRLVGRRVGLTARREEAPRPEFRVLLVFNPPPNLSAAQLCDGKVAFAPPTQAGRVTVLAAFCDAGGLLASASGRVGAVTGIDDQRFRDWLGQLTRDLFGGP